MIQGHGASNPDVMIIGDYGQGEDISSNYALQGYKRNLLEALAHNAGFNLKDTYTTLLIKDKLEDLSTFTVLKGKDGKTRKVSKKKKQSDIEQGKLICENLAPAFSQILLEEIRTLKPNLLVPLGEATFQYLTGLESIRKFRGSILPLSPLHGIEKYTKVLPVLGPYPYLYKEYKQKFISQVDFNKIPRWSDGKPIPDDTFRIWIAKSATAFRNYLNRVYPLCAERTIEQGGFCVFDIETHWNIPTCISFCFDGFESVCVPIIDPEIDFVERALMLGLVAEVLASPIPKVNQNIKYDWKTEERWYCKVNNVIGDTMIAASCIYPEFPKNLGFLTSLYTDLPYFKDEGKSYDPSKGARTRFYLYNAKDSLSCHQIFTKQQEEIEELNVGFVYDKMMQLLPIYRKMEDRGLRVDAERRAKLIAKYQSQFRIQLFMLRSLVNQDDLNPLSWVQSDRVIFQELGYRKIQGVKSTDEESIQMLMCKGHPENCTIEKGRQILTQFLRCRKLHKVLEALTLDLHPDGRFRFEANLGGAETGRTTTSQTTDYFIKEVFEGKKQKIKKINLGHSVQNIGKHGFFIDDILFGTDIRSMYIPSPGYLFGEIDLAGAEARVDRVLSGNFDLNVFDNPGIHKLTGSWLFDCTPQEIKKGTHEYHLAKTFRHAGERNMGANRAFMMCQDDGTGLSLTLKDVTEKLNKFHLHEPQIRSTYHRDIEISLKADNRLVCPNLRRRDFFDRIDHHSINEGISFLPQAIVSDQTKFSFIPTTVEASWAYLLMEAHDGSLWEFPKDRGEEFCKIYKKNIETPIDFRVGSLKRDYKLTIPCESSIGENWEEMKGIKI